MYSVRPYFEIKKVRLPHCMYQMKPLHKLTGMKTGPDEVCPAAAAAAAAAGRRYTVLVRERVCEAVLCSVACTHTA